MARCVSPRASLSLALWRASAMLANLVTDERQAATAGRDADHAEGLGDPRSEAPGRDGRAQETRSARPEAVGVHAPAPRRGLRSTWAGHASLSRRHRWAYLPGPARWSARGWDIFRDSRRRLGSLRRRF